MAVADSRRAGEPRAIPGSGGPDDADRPAAVVRPPTLGDALNEVMRRRTHSSDAAARAMGVTTSAVRAWSADQEWPEPEHVAALLEYLQVDERRLRALVLRGQMRRIEDRIRN